MAQTSLFNTSSSVSGFRLDYMEVYNWGTFDKEVFKINPQGNNSLLTGANASGKSTLIDALLTLLVPLKRKRLYNQSSGVEKKGSRTEESYFYGYYGNQQIEGSSGTTTLKLRDKNTYSVILASFANIDERTVTLFQIRYFSGEDVKTLFGIARQSLSISNDFSDFKNDGAWRKRLEKRFNSNSTKRMIEFFDGPVSYQEKMLDLFGMRSEKALTLFNQIVGVKVLDDLDSFIHDNMLEEMSAEDKYTELKENFQNLMEAKISIDKAKEQITQLKPINELADKLTEIDKELEGLRQEKDLAACWFAQRTSELCQKEIGKMEEEIGRLEEEKKQIEENKGKLDEERTGLKVSIENDEVGRRISDIEKEIGELEKKRITRLGNADKYCNIVRKVGLDTELNQECFNSNRQRANEEKARLQKVLDIEISEKKRAAQNKDEEIEKEIKSKIAVVNYLQQHKNNITDRVAEIRDEILEYTGASTEEIPFIGELMKVKEDEREWEMAIERILHSFALRLIVPDKYYRQVNEYVNSHNLKGRIVYQHFTGYTSLREMEGRRIEPYLLPNKLEFKTKNAYSEWVEHIIYQKFAYACVKNLDEFNHYKEMAVTREGLVKSLNGKHEKDDREGSSNKANYVLGWDNKEKIALLQNEVRNLQTEQKRIQARLREIDAEKNKTEGLKENYGKVIDLFSTFDEINWQPYAESIQKKTLEKDTLEKTNDRVRVLKERLEKVEAEIKALENQSAANVRQSAEKNIANEQLKQKKHQNDEALAQIGEVDTSLFEQEHPELSYVRLNDIDRERDKFQNTNSDACTREKEERTKTVSRVSALINNFKNPPASITDMFRDWRSDVSSLPDAVHIELIGEYQIYYKKLVEENLPGFEGKFNKYLHETVTINVQSFRQFFKKWAEDITRTIGQLNASLKDINFSNYPPTYIQLSANRKFDIDVNDFNSMLDKAIPNLREVESTIDGRKNHFENNIAPFIRRLEDEEWRTKVMDVRSWYTYKAEEYFKADDQRRKVYESMGQLSGGEKAQLTYTILGSAIAYQFGLTKSGLDSSFRFIAIDEAFKAQDEDRARYLIELCKQLNLQLLVVTPSDNIHIVENDISYVHYVERQGNKSILYNMPIRQFKEQRDNSMQS